MLCRLTRYSCIYESRMSPTLNGSSAIRRFKHSDAIEIHDGITFDFYTGLSHIGPANAHPSLIRIFSHTMYKQTERHCSSSQSTLLLVGAGTSIWTIPGHTSTLSRTVTRRLLQPSFLVGTLTHVLCHSHTL